MLLNAESFRRQIRRRGEPVEWSRASPARDAPRNEASWESRLSPTGAGVKLLPNYAHGYLYTKTDPSACAGGCYARVWIFNAQRSMKQNSQGVNAEGDASVVWMPDEIALARPDKLTRITQSSPPQRESVEWPAPHGASLNRYRLRVSRVTAFDVDALWLVDASGTATLKKGVDWELATPPVPAPAGASVYGLGMDGAFEVEWLNPASVPAPGARIAIEYRYRPAYYFLGESENPRRNAVSPLGHVTNVPLPRSGRLCLTHPDANEYIAPN